MENFLDEKAVIQETKMGSRGTWEVDSCGYLPWGLSSCGPFSRAWAEMASHRDSFCTAATRGQEATEE